MRLFTSALIIFWIFSLVIAESKISNDKNLPTTSSQNHTLLPKHSQNPGYSKNIATAMFMTVFTIAFSFGIFHLIDASEATNLTEEAAIMISFGSSTFILFVLMGIWELVRRSLGNGGHSGYEVIDSIV